MIGKHTVALKLEGNVSLADFSTVVDAFSQLIATLTEEVNPDVGIDWNIATLEAGSATVVSRGFFGGNAEAEEAVVAVVQKYEGLGRDAERGDLEGYSVFVRERMEQITSVVNGRIPRIKMGVDRDDWFASISRRIAEDAINTNANGGASEASFRIASRSAVKGQIVTADDKRATYFTLAEAYTRRFIRCWPEKKWREKIGLYWSTGEYVLVEGTFSRYAKSPTITAITDIVPMGDAPQDGWRQAIGCAPRDPKGIKDTAAEIIRRGRDGEE